MAEDPEHPRDVASETNLRDRPRYLFVTGRLAEFALRQVLDDLAPRAGFQAEVAVLPISVAALMTPRWAARHLAVPEGIDRMILPGYCHGDLAPIVANAHGVPVELGPEDLRDLPGYFGQADQPVAGYGAYRIEILAEINHAPRLPLNDLIGQAQRFRGEGADVIDLGCEPGTPWAAVGDAVAALRDQGLRVSIDSFDPAEVSAAVAAGAELVLSVNAANRERAPEWGVEVVAIPDQPGSLSGLDPTVEFLTRKGVPFRIDPILEPIGFGFAASLGRYLEVRRRYPDAAILMGVGNLTELTDVDSAGVNAILVGFCEELSIGSVLTTAVINWARSSVRELDLARRLVHHAVARRTLPKHLEPRLVALRDPRVVEFGAENLAELQRRIRDPNWRLFAEGGWIYALNHQHLLRDTDPFRLFEQMGVSDASHAFYLGYELWKATTALTLSKSYRQDQALEWGFLTRPEASHRARREARADPGSRGADPGPAPEGMAEGEESGGGGA
jgi:dihydropteroate synthase